MGVPTLPTPELVGWARPPTVVDHRRTHRTGFAHPTGWVTRVRGKFGIAGSEARWTIGGGWRELFVQQKPLGWLDFRDQVVA